MVLLKTLGFVVILLFVHHSLSFNVIFEGVDTSPVHARERRAATIFPTVHQFQTVIKLSDLQKLWLILNNLTLPLPLNNTGNITSIDTTTVCSLNSTNGYQCKCEESYAWSYNTCLVHEACDAIIGNTCRCINALPPDGLYCQPNISQTEPIEIDIVLYVRIPVSIVPSNFLDIFRIYLQNVQYPQPISQTLKVLHLNFTTGCYPNITGGLQCQCEGQFAWSCDQCNTYGTCSNSSSQTCDCINGLPDGQYCKPITNDSWCPTPEPPTTMPTPNITTPVSTPNITTPNMTTPTTTPNITPNMTTPNITTPNITTPNITTPNITIPTTTPNITTPNITTPNITTPNITIPTTTPNITTPDITTPNITTPNITTPVSTPNIPTPNMTTPNITTPNITPNITTPTTTPNITTPNMTTPNITTPLSTPNIPTPNMTTPNITTPNITTPNITTPTTTPNITTPNITTQVTTPNITTPTTTPNITTQVTMPNITTPTTTPNITTPVSTPNITTQVTTPNITTPRPITTTSVTTEKTTTPTITTMTLASAPPATTGSSTTQSLSLTFNMDFKEEYNDPNGQFYKNISKAINDQSGKHIKNPKVEIISVKSGSVIVDYTITAPSIQQSDVNNITTGLFTELEKIYPVVFDSPDFLKFEPAEVFFGKTVKLTCGPPPASLSFGTGWKPEWRRNDEIISADSGHILNQDSAATLTVNRFYFTDNGNYECRLIRTDNSFFRQRSNGNFTFKEAPQITITPVKTFVKCGSGNINVTCSVSRPYNVSFVGLSGAGQTISRPVSEPSPCKDGERQTVTCRSNTGPVYERVITVDYGENIVCSGDLTYGDGPLDYKSEVACPAGEEGKRSAVCKASGKFEDEQNNCILKPVKELLDQSEALTADTLPQFLSRLSDITTNDSITEKVIESPANIGAIVKILSNVANASSSLKVLFDRAQMTDILKTAGVLTSDGAKGSWNFLNNNDTKTNTTNDRDSRSNIPRSDNITEYSVSSSFLQSLEDITDRLSNASFDIETKFISLNKTTFTDSFNGDFNSSVEIDIPESDGGNKSITVITFSSMDNVLPARDKVNSSNNAINGKVVLIQSSSTVDNISLTFDVLNGSLLNPQCVFWNFTLFDGLGGWDNEGCVLEEFNQTVTCRCNHLTSFSILMSPYAPKDLVLELITYIGVGISMASLVICLIIEAVVWRKIRKSTVAYLRHVSIVNIAVSLLIANIWFIIGAAIYDADKKNPPACTAATFFIHLFYLALFFWMLASALLLLYRTISVFDGGLSKSAMLAIGFCVGYGAPIIIVTISIAVTAPSKEYIRLTGGCWLNWDESRALLAFVIPALLIVAINLIILCVVMYKMLRSRAASSAAQAGERHVLLVIARSLAVLTPFFGLTWGLGVGTMTRPYNRGAHISFAFFNSLQGFFILVFGTLLDKQVRTGIAEISQISSGRTRSTSGGGSSSGAFGFFQNWRRGRDGYNMSAATSGGSHSFNT